MAFHHISVMPEETVNGLMTNLSGTYVDCTLGGAGHSLRIAKRLSENGRLIGIDQDESAIEAATQRLREAKEKGEITCSFDVVKSNFSALENILQETGANEIDGILFDLGVSSHQLDTADRGFSDHKDALLDMRMSKSGMSAKDVVNSYGEEELANILFRYGEEKFSRRIAKNIVLFRQDKPIETTGELVDIIKASYPKAKMRDSHPARKTFQALRIEVNAELDVLDKTLDKALDCLAPGGRISVITFHSLEDRIVKEKFNKWVNPCTCPKEFPVCVCSNKALGKLVFKSKAPTEAELEENPRARSSRLRCFEKY